MNPLLAIRRCFPCFLRDHDLMPRFRIGGIHIYRCKRCGKNERNY